MLKLENKVTQMQRNNISIAKKTLNLLKKKSWNKISLSEIYKSKKNFPIKNKDELLTNINRYFDFLLKKNLSSLEESSKKDMLFEVLMARLDILNLHRKSIKNLIKYFYSNPKDFVKLLPSFVETIILIASISNININGIKGIPKIKAIFLLYVLIIYTWNNDETESLEKTMTTLDKYLVNLNKFTNFL